MERLARLQREMTCQAAIVLSGVNRFYLTGFASSAGTLVITRERLFLLVDSRDIQAAQERVQNCEVLLEEGPGQLAGLLQSLGIESAAFETNYITVERAAQLRQDIAPVRLEETPDFGKLLLKMRRHKDDYELECLRKAQQITDEAFQVLLGKIRPGVSELDLMMCLGEEMARRGCEKRSFNMIFTSGERTSLPHGDPTVRQVGYGDFVMMDVGAMVGGYAADMTRTVAVGAVTEEQRRIYEIVLEAQKRAIDAVRPGKPCKEVDAVAREYIASQGYGGCFGHGLGHSLGLEIHEDPRFNQVCGDPLEEGVVITVEPGIYLPGKFGVRIEDMVVVTKTGCEDLTHSPKELIVL